MKIRKIKWENESTNLPSELDTPAGLTVQEIKEYCSQHYGTKVVSFEFDAKKDIAQAKKELATIMFEQLSIGDSYYVGTDDALIYTSPNLKGWKCLAFEELENDGYAVFKCVIAQEEHLFFDKGITLGKRILLGCDTAGFYFGPTEHLERDCNNVRTGADGYFGVASEGVDENGNVKFIEIEFEIAEELYDSTKFINFTNKGEWV